MAKPIFVQPVTNQKTTRELLEQRVNAAIDALWQHGIDLAANGDLPLFPDVAAGLAGTSSGEAFRVRSDEEDGLFDYYLNAGEAESLGTLPSTGAIQALQQRVDELDQLISTLSIRLMASISGGIDAESQILAFIVPEDALLGENFPNSYARGTPAPSGEVTFEVQLQGVPVAEITFSSGQTTAYFTKLWVEEAPLPIGVGQVVSIVSPDDLFGMDSFSLTMTLVSVDPQ